MFTPKYPPGGGGIACHVNNLCKSLVDMGHEIMVISPSRLNSVSYTSSGLIVLRIKSWYLPPWPFSSLSSVCFSPPLLQIMRKIMRKKPPQIIHVHGHHYPLNWFGIEFAKRNRIPTVLTMHGLSALNPHIYGNEAFIEELLHRTLFKYVFNRTNAIIGLTTSVTEYAKRYGVSIPHFFTISNGVNLERYFFNMNKKNKYRSKYGLPKNVKIILFIGRFTASKGALEATYAAREITKRHQNIFFLFVGDGILKGQMKKILHSSDNVEILDWQPQDSVHELFLASDIYLLTSKMEALPITVLEAMAAQLHCVVTPIGGVPDILKRYPFKTYITALSPPQIIKALRNALNSKDYDEKKKIDGISYIKRFSWKKVAKDTNKVYDRILEVA